MRNAIKSFPWIMKYLRVHFEDCNEALSTSAYLQTQQNHSVVRNIIDERSAAARRKKIVQKVHLCFTLERFV